MRSPEIPVPEKEGCWRKAQVDIYFLRHGEAGKRMPAVARDRDRPLTAVGKDEMEEIGEAIADSGFKFDIVATSPLRRSKDSATIVNKALKRKTGVEEWPELSPEGSREALLRRLARLKPDSAILCVGHEPFLTSAIGEVISKGEGGGGSVRISLKKGGLAKVSVSGFNPRISGELRWLLTPKQIKKLA